MKKALLLSLLLTGIFGLQAQVQIDHPIHLTGSGSNAKITGIQQVTQSGHAVNAQTIQQNALVYSADGGSANNYAVTLAPAVTGYTAGMIVNFIAANANTGASTISVNGLTGKTIKKQVTNVLAANDILANQSVSVMYDGTNFQMLSQLGNAGSASASNMVFTFSASYSYIAFLPGHSSAVVNLTSTYVSGTPSPVVYTVSGVPTGVTYVLAPGGGYPSLISSLVFTASLSATPGTYNLTVTAIGGQTNQSVSLTLIILTGKQAFNYTGANQTFTVPTGIHAINIKLWGAGGSGTNNTNYNFNVAGFGGGGAFVNGVLTVTPGQVLNVIVGQGAVSDGSSAFGGGGPSGAAAGGGGGRSAVQVTSGIDVITAGGGGGAGVPQNQNYYGNGGGGGATTGGNGTTGDPSDCVGSGGYGATTTAAGVGGISCIQTSGYGGATGSQYLGANGNGNYGSGGGGGGYYGGGAGDCWLGAGGGGGSSYYSSSVVSLVTMEAGVTSANATGNQPYPGGASDLDYTGITGKGGYDVTGTHQEGGNGSVVISW